MGENSKIEWTDHTFNPWIGCTPVARECDHCYAETQDAYRSWTPEGWGVGKPRKRTAASTWANPLAWNREAQRRGTRFRIFCASLADVFDTEVPQEWRHDLFEMIRETAHLDWLLLTKRAAAAHHYLNRIAEVPINMWLGTSVGTVERRRQIDVLRQTRASIRFLSVEPLLEDLGTIDLTGIHWVIVGGESGAGARPMHPGWARSLRDQCLNAGVAFFFKQWGEWAPRGNHPDSSASRIHIFSDAEDTGLLTRDTTEMVKVGKKVAGRLLDGRTWNEIPLQPYVTHAIT